MFMLGVDVGGTFTDLVAVDPATAEVRIAKIPSRPDDPAEVIAAGVEELGLATARLGRLIHGTTVATNALLERRGAITGLLTTRGFRDVIQIGRGRRLAEGGMFDIQFRRPPPLVPRELRLEVSERVRAGGEVLAALSAEDVRKAAEEFRRRGVEAVAICFLHSYSFPDHEAAAAELLRKHLGDKVFLSLSSAVNPQFREFERFSTAVVNAYVGPVVERYLTEIRGHPIAGLDGGSIHIMGSTGGVMDLESAALLPVRTILSGPAGGVTGARHAGLEVGLDNLIACDMGGTSTDVSLLKGDRLLYASETIISGVPIRAAQLEINTVGAGAGSIVWVDVDGALCVGPMSAGSVPGPACYGHGGDAPTVTDANVVLNRISHGTLLGGRIRVQGDLARGAMAGIQQRLGFRGAPEAAEGALEILVARTVRAIREVSLERGFDPRDFALVAFGGAGPMHATAIAEGLGIATVVVPNHPGNLSALGLVVAAVRRDESATFLAHISALDLGELKARLGRMASAIAERLGRDGVVAGSVRLSCFLEMRCVGQAHEIAVPVGGDPAKLDAASIQGSFETIYAERYGRAPEPDIDVEIINLRVLGEGEVGSFPPDIWRPALPRDGGAPGQRRVWFAGDEHETRIYDRARLASGAELAGPAIVEESGATTVIPPGWGGAVHESGHLLLGRR